MGAFPGSAPWSALVALAIVPAGAVLAAGLASPEPGLSQDAVGGAVLGRNLGSYKTGVFEGRLDESYPASSSYRGRYLYALVWRDARVAVFAPRTENRAIALVTWNRRHRTDRGIGPCSRQAALLARYGRSAVAVRRGGRLVAYRVGRLWFTLERSGRIGAVQLSTDELGVGAALELRRTDVPRVC